MSTEENRVVCPHCKKALARFENEDELIVEASVKCPHCHESFGFFIRKNAVHYLY